MPCPQVGHILVRRALVEAWPLGGPTLLALLYCCAQVIHSPLPSTPPPLTTRFTPSPLHPSTPTNHSLHTTNHSSSLQTSIEVRNLETKREMVAERERAE